MPRARKTPPNILHVMFDQMAALSLPCYGHPLVKAPNLRALAESGSSSSRPIATRRSARPRAMP
jgi:Arylsulfatase A and related enzymes